MHIDTNTVYHLFDESRWICSIKKSTWGQSPCALFAIRKNPFYSIALNSFGALLYSRPMTTIVMTVSTAMKLPLYVSE